ncbi:pseudoazurin [Roseibium sp. TrichSKD4]|uniref:pseudoazurin n=1 Tax=Roseibium sp. TrichSKD4 TaxID=744980 RepID=UPI00058E06E0|nr:pseudoazurin [Roseibium sp. TrichSKD4]
MLTRRNVLISMSALAGVGSALACPAPSTDGQSHGVLMLNAACGDPKTPNVFEPTILRINIGDRVTFLPTHAGHNSASKRGMIPEGATHWNGAIDEPLTVELTVPGIYGHICVPHYEWGMVGLIVVGNDLSNLKSIKKIRHPGDARKVFRNLLKEVLL